MKLATALDSAARITDPELVIYRANNGQYMVGRVGMPYLTKAVWTPTDFIEQFSTAKQGAV